MDWLAFITKDERFGLSPEFTEKVISVFSRHFGYMTTNDRNALCDQLRKYPCIVTKQGMRAPLDCYFKYVNLFHDLPTVHFTGSKSVSDVFLKALGVREHVDLQTIFDRLTDLDWDHVMLIRYLASVQDKLSEIEWGRLKATSMFPKEPISIDSPVVRMKAADLYEPHEAAKQFSLPALEWKKSKWRTNSDECKVV